MPIQYQSYVSCLGEASPLLTQHEAVAQRHYGEGNNKAVLFRLPHIEEMVRHPNTRYCGGRGNK